MKEATLYFAKSGFWTIEYKFLAKGTTNVQIRRIPQKGLKEAKIALDAAEKRGYFINNNVQ